jgi:muramidase (phage lysozyme)
MNFDPSPVELRCLALIMRRESSARYNVLTGGGSFASYLHFPIWAGHNGSHAAGAYQFEPATWHWLAAELFLPDFSPLSQNIAALALLRRAGTNSTESWAATGPYPTPAELENP